MELKGSKTERNLLTSFAGESQARTRYTYYASVAKKEGYEQISSIFTETADNEKEHAKVFFKYLAAVGEPVMINDGATFPTVYGDTAANLASAADGEHEEWSKDYAEFARIAREEGFTEIAVSFEKIASVEEHHELRYRKLLANIKGETVFKKGNKVYWKCRNCGYWHEGEAAPSLCPACKHPQAYFELLAENY